MKQTQRLRHLQVLLSGNKHTYATLLDYFKKKKVAIGLRQLQRDIKDLQLFLGKDEQLIKSRGTSNVLELEIKKIKSHNEQFNIEESIFKTPTNIKNIEKMLSFFSLAIAKKSAVYIGKLKNDVTSFNTELKDISFTIIPFNIIHHRENYYLGCYILKTKQYSIFEIKQLAEYKMYRKLKHYDYDELVLGYRNFAKGIFGVTKNINDKIYSIKLEFSSVLGTYIKNFVWHHSQKIKHKDNTIVMTMKCGINRELVGWIFSWMYNVRIIEPPELKAYYNKTIKEIQKINKKDMLLYRNIFVEKK